MAQRYISLARALINVDREWSGACTCQSLSHVSQLLSRAINAPQNGTGSYDEFYAAAVKLNGTAITVSII